jgi:undecaprenyl diphosphate synthase
MGSKVVRMVVEVSRKIGIEVLTLYAFSEENWNRPKNEISALMKLLSEYLKKELPKMMEENIRLNAIGKLDSLPDFVQKVLRDTMAETGKNRSMTLNLALSYSARGEIINAVRTLAGLAKEGKIAPSDIDEALFAEQLYTRDLPDPDLLIRTSGEMRISNFLLYQIAYTELYLTKTHWPDFTKEEYLKALYDYASRERRFGLTSEQIQRKM